MKDTINVPGGIYWEPGWEDAEQEYDVTDIDETMPDVEELPFK